MARANAEYWAELGVRTIWQNDFTKAKRLLLDHTMEHHPAFRRAAAGDLLAMKPERQPIPADVVSISDLRAAREAAAELTVQENEKTSPRFVKYRPFNATLRRSEIAGSSEGSTCRLEPEIAV